MSYIGDIALEKTFDTKFTTVTTTGAPTVLAGSPVISAYVDNSTTQLTAGITLSVDFDGVVGLNNVRVVATAANGYAAGSNYQLVITTGTVGGTSVVGYVVAEFSIQARSSLRPTTADRTLDVSAGGEAGLDWANIGSPTTANNLSATNIDVDQIVASVSGAVGSVTAGVNVTQLGGVTQSLTDLKDFADDGYDPATNKVQGVVLTDTVTTYTGNTPQTGDNFARLGAPAGASISADIAAIEAQTDDIGAAGAGLTAIPWNAAWDAEVQSEVDDALVAQNLDHLVKIAVDTDFATTVHLNSVVGHLADNGTSASFDRTTDSLEALEVKVEAVDNFIDTEVASILTAVDTEVGAIKTVTDALPNAGALTTIQSDLDDIQTRLPATLVSGRIDASVGAMAANTLTASALATDAVTEIQSGLSTLTAAQVNTEVVDALTIDTIADSYAADGAQPTIAQAILAIQQFLTEKSVTSTTVTVKKPNGSTTAFTLTLDSATTPTSITRAT